MEFGTEYLVKENIRPSFTYAAIISIVFYFGFSVGEYNVKSNIKNAFAVLEGDNGSDHPVAVCMRQHFDELNVPQQTKKD
jgi:hypothetical protein